MSEQITIYFQFVVIFAIIDYGKPKYGSYLYLGWAQLIGWIICVFLITWIPGVAIYEVWKQKGSLKEVCFSYVHFARCTFTQLSLLTIRIDFCLI